MLTHYKGMALRPFLTIDIFADIAFFIKIKLSKYRYYFIFSSFKNLVWLLKIKCINEPPQTARGQTDQIWKRSEREVGAGEDTKYCWNYLAGEIYPAYMFLMEYQAKRQNCRSQLQYVLIRENKKCITWMWVNIHVMLGENKYVTCMWVCLGR